MIGKYKAYNIIGKNTFLFSKNKGAVGSLYSCWIVEPEKGFNLAQNAGFFFFF